MENNQNENPSVFKKQIKLFDAIALVSGSMIGSGVFIVSSSMARELGSTGWILAAWLLGTILTIIAALSYGELAGMMPWAGGQYVYLREAYHPIVAFLYGWTLFLVIQTGTIAAVAVGFAKFSGVIFPFINEQSLLWESYFIKFNTVKILAIAMAIFLTLLNLNGIKLGRWIQNIFTSVKAITLLIIILGGIFLSQVNYLGSPFSVEFWDASQIIDQKEQSISGIGIVIAMGIAMVGVIFSLDAWNNLTFTAGEIVNPKKNLPLGLFLGTLLAGLLYVFINVIYLKLLPLKGNPEATDVLGRGIQFALNDRLGTAAMTQLVGNSAIWVMAVFIMISTFGSNNGIILSGARAYYAMAQDGLFFKKAASLNNKGVPAFGLKAQCLWVIVLCMTGSYLDLLDYVVFSVLLFYILTIFGIFILRKKRPEIERPVKAFAYPFLQGFYIIISLIIMFILLIYKPQFTWPGLIIVVSGIPIYFVWKKKNKNI